MQSLYNLSIRFCTRSFFSPHSRCRTRSLWGDGDLEANGFPGAGSRGCQQCSAMLCPFAVRVGKWKWDPVTKQKTGWKDPGGFSYSCSFVGCRFFMLFIIFLCLIWVWLKVRTKSLGDLEHGLHLKGKGTCVLKSVTGVWESHWSCKQPSDFTMN